MMGIILQGNLLFNLKLLLCCCFLKYFKGYIYIFFFSNIELELYMRGLFFPCLSGENYFSVPENGFNVWEHSHLGKKKLMAFHKSRMSKKVTTLLC